MRKKTSIREKPTVRWRALVGHVHWFTEASVSETEKILDEYQSRINLVQGDQGAILAEVKRVILKLNELSGMEEDGTQIRKYPGLILTDGREELCEFVEGCAIDAGLQTDDDDITFEWRKW